MKRCFVWWAGKGAGRQWRPQNAVSILKHRPSRQARPGKSSFFRLLAVKDEWFSDDLRRLDDDNVYRKLQGHWIIEMSEMIATANAKSIEEIKSFLSKQKETYKVPYETHPADRLRQCVFAGTTNRQDFLPRDRTGNRRFISPSRWMRNWLRPTFWTTRRNLAPISISSGQKP